MFTIQIDLTATDMASPSIAQVGDELGQLGQTQSDAVNSTKQLAEETSKTNEVFGNFKQEILGVVSSYGLLQIGAKVSEFYQLGQEVRTASATFTQLSGGEAQAATNLQLMREATGGATSDLVLMEGASRLLLMGLVSTGQEAARMEGLAIRLGAAVGQNAKEAVENLALTLSNLSYQRLDQLGISASAVRTRVNELKDAGIEVQAAFSQAVMEQGQLAIRRLGTAADVAITPIDLLKTKIENLAQSVSQDFATAVNGLVGIGMAIAENPDSAAGWEALGQTLVEYATIGVKRDTSMDSAIHDAASRWAGTATDAAISATVDAASAATDANAAEIARLNAAQRVVYQELGAEHSTRYWNAFSSFWQEKQIQFSRDAQTQPGFILPPDSEWAQIARNNAEAASIAAQEELQRQASAMGSFQTVMQGMMDFTGNSTVPEFLDAEGAQRYADELELVTQQIGYMQTLNDQGFISDTDLQSAEMLKDKVSDMADQADRAKQAFDNLSLSDVFGQGSGGLQGQISDDILKAAQERGMKGDDLEALKQAMDLQTGRATTASEFYQSTIVPMLADAVNADQTTGLALMDTVNTYLQQATLNNLSNDQIVAGLKAIAGGAQSDAGATFTITPFQQPGMQQLVGQNLAGSPDDVAKMLKDQFHITVSPKDLGGLTGMGVDTTISADELTPKIRDAMLAEMMKQFDPQGLGLVSKDDVLKDPSFQAAVTTAVTQAVAQINQTGTMPLTGASTVSGAAAMYNLTPQQIMSAANITDPRLLQPGTYTVPGYSANMNFDPVAFAQMQANGGGLAPMSDMAGAGPTDMTQNLKDMVEPAQQVSGSMTEVQDSTKEIGANLDTVRESLDSLSKGVHKINVELNVTNLDFINSLVVGQGVAAGGGTRTKPVRDQGGTVKGMDARTVD